VLHFTNVSPYSLAAGEWSGDIARVHHFAKRVKASTVPINTYGPTDVRLPRSGTRDSGFGREHGDMPRPPLEKPQHQIVDAAERRVDEPRGAQAAAANEAEQKPAGLPEMKVKKSLSVMTHINLGFWQGS
jgi:hypothetical protein